MSDAGAIVVAAEAPDRDTELVALRAEVENLRSALRFASRVIAERTRQLREHVEFRREVLKLIERLESASNGAGR